MLQNVRYAVRTLAKTPGFTAVVVLTLTLGIGVTTAVFSIFNGVLLRPLEYPKPEELVRVYDTQPACKTCPASFPKYHDWRARNQVFSAIGGMTQWSFVLTGDGEPTRLTAGVATASLIDVLQISPFLGRWFTEQEEQAGGPKVVVLGYDLWNRQMNADRGILGRKLILDGEPYEVIGVMPASFRFGRRDIYKPLQRKLDPATRGSHFLPIYARLKPGVSIERASREMRALGESLAKEFGTNHGVDVQSYLESIVGNVRTPLNVLLGAVFLTLLIACANVANLLLASGLARRRELAIRMALGAGPRDLARQLATESVLLSVTGGLLGVLLSQWIVDTFLTLAANQLPRATAVQIDGRVLAFTAVISILVGLFCSLWPIVLLCRKDLASAVREGDVRSGSQTGRAVGNGLVVAEIALAFALLAGSGLLIKNLILLQQRDAGIRTDHIVAFDVALAGARYEKPEAVVAFYRDFYSRLAQVNTIESAGMTSHLPMYDYGWNSEFNVEGGNPWGDNDAPLVEHRWIYGDYLKTMGVPLLKGRLLDQRDGDKTLTALINKSAAEKFWPGKDPIGRKFGHGNDPSKWFEVVGVIGDIRSYGIAARMPYEFYRTIEQSPFNAMTVVIRTRGEDTTAIIPTARQIIAGLDPALPITQIQTMEKVVADSVGQPRLTSALSGLFGGLAGILAMGGIYSVMAYNVRRQRREFGVRIALGASPGNLRKLVIHRGALLAGVGLAIGGFGAWALTGVLKTMLHDVKPADPAVFIGTAVTVLAIALLASYLPARSAARTDPMIVLRTE